MIWPNWAKFSYWVAILVVVTWLLFFKLDVTAVGRATPFNAVVFVVWVALVLAPLFTEVKIWGVSLKREIEKTQRDVEAAKDIILREMNSIRMDVRNSVHVSPIFNHSVLAPPPDSSFLLCNKE